MSDLDPLAGFKRPVQIDDHGRLFIAADCGDWASIVAEHRLSVIVDLERDLDRGIPGDADSVVYVYYPIRDEELPPLKRLHAVARFGADMLQRGERVLVHCEMGLNRSALLAGLMMVHDGESGATALERLQARRPGALYNLLFADYLRSQPPGGAPLALD